jgi:hypothetical protein
MSKELHITTWCDGCQAEGKEPAQGQTHVLSIDGPALELDLCDAHWVELLLPYTSELLEKAGRQPEVAGGPYPPKRVKGGNKGSNVHRSVAGLMTHQRKGKPPSRARDLVCGWCPMTYAGAQALSAHVRNVHGLQFLHPDELFGGRCPLCGNDSRILNQHSQREHGGSWGQAYRMALAAGDPYGLAAPVERRAHDVAR